MKAVMRKGFFRIIEVVIVAVLVFVTLTQMYAVPKANQPWDMTKLSIISQDLLYTMDAKGIDWFNATDVNRTLYTVLPRTMGYAVRVRQDVRKEMRVGCVCSVADYTSVRAILTNFTLNNISRNFTLTRIPLNTLDLSGASPHRQNEAILLCQTQPFTAAGISDAEAYLAGGGGIVELSDLTESGVSGSRWYSDVMNIQWATGSVAPPSGRAYFPFMYPDERRYPIHKIFFYAPPVIPSFTSFANFGGGAETVYPADSAAEKILVVQDTLYVGGAFDGREVPLSMLDWGVNGSGRVAWMSNASISGGSADEESAKKLLKTLVMWAASGKDYQIVDGAVSTGATATMRKAYGNGTSMYEPVRIYLTVGYHY